MIMKKIGAIVLSIAMIFSMMPFVASSGFSYAVNDKAKLQLEIVKAYDNGDEKGYQALSLDEIRSISAGDKFLLGVKAIDFSKIPELGSGGEHLAHLSFGLLYDAKAFKVEPNSRSTAKATRGQLDPSKARKNISSRVYNVSSTWAFELEEDDGDYYENEYYTVGAADYDDATNFYHSNGEAGKSTEHNFYLEVDSDAYYNAGSSSGTWDGSTDEYVAVIEFTANSIPSDGLLNAIDFVIDREEDTSGENTLQTENGFYQKAGGYATNILTVIDYIRNASQLEPDDPTAKRLTGTGVLSGQTTVGSNLTATFTLTGDIPENVTITWYRKVMDKDDVMLEVAGVSPKTVSVTSNTASSSYIISAADLAANTDPDGYVRLYAVATCPDKDGNDKLLYRGEIISVISDDVEQGKEITAGNITVSPNTGLYYGSTLTASGSVTAVSEGEPPQQSKLIYTWRYSDDTASSLQSGSEKTYTLTAEDVAHCIDNESGIICVLSAEGFSGSVESAATETPQRIALTAPTSVAILTANSNPNNIPTLREGATASELVKNLVYTFPAGSGIIKGDGTNNDIITIAYTLTYPNSALTMKVGDTPDPTLTLTYAYTVDDNGTPADNTDDFNVYTLVDGDENDDSNNALGYTFTPANIVITGKIAKDPIKSVTINGSLTKNSYNVGELVALAGLTVKTETDGGTEKTYSTVKAAADAGAKIYLNGKDVTEAIKKGSSASDAEKQYALAATSMDKASDGLELVVTFDAGTANAKSGSKELEITVSDPYTSLAITTMPTKTTQIYGSVIDLSGLTLTASKASGADPAMNLSTILNLMKQGKMTMKIGNTALAVNAEGTALTTTAVLAMNETNSTAGTQAPTLGGNLVITYKPDGQTASVSTVPSGDTNRISINRRELKLSDSLTIKPIEIAESATLPVAQPAAADRKISYSYLDGAIDADKADAKLSATWSIASGNVLETTDSASKPTASSDSTINKDLTITIAGSSAENYVITTNPVNKTLTLKLSQNPIVSIAVTALPNMEYTYSSTDTPKLSLAGLKITATKTYAPTTAELSLADILADDNTVIKIAKKDGSGDIIIPKTAIDASTGTTTVALDMLMQGQPIEIAYQGFTAKTTDVAASASVKNVFAITDPIKSADATTEPKTAYTYGQNLDLAGLVVTVETEGGTETPFDFSAGEITAANGFKIELLDEDGNAIDLGGKNPLTSADIKMQPEMKTIKITYTDPADSTNKVTDTIDLSALAKANTTLEVAEGTDGSLSFTGTAFDSAAKPPKFVAKVKGNVEVNSWDDPELFTIQVYSAEDDTFANTLGTWSVGADGKGTGTALAALSEAGVAGNPSYRLVVNFLGDTDKMNASGPEAFTYNVTEQKKSSGGGGGTGSTTVVDITPVEEETDDRLIIPIPAIPDDTPMKPYMKGYREEDGSTVFRPGIGITRAEVATLIARLLPGYDESLSYDPESLEFGDIEGSAWYKNTVYFAVQKGLVNGYEDGSFRPDQTISRQEFAAIIARYLELANEGESEYSDNDGWGKGYISQLSRAHIKVGDNDPDDDTVLNGYEDGTFRPNNDITRAEVTKVLNRVFGRKPNEDKIKANIGKYDVSLVDVPETFWAYYEILVAASEYTYGEFH